MTIDVTHKLPTGYLFTGNYTRGQLEALSIGDYGRDKNVKADFLGYTREINGVPNGKCMPLSEKWVVTLSSQYGCPMKCNFCDVPNIKFNGNASYDDLSDQLYDAIGLFKDIRYTERLNIHFARMGEPIFNKNVFDFARDLASTRVKRRIQDDLNLRIETIHPVLTTSLPKKYKDLPYSLVDWCDIKNNHYHGQAGLQFSINSTNESQRDEMFGGLQLSLKEFSVIAGMDLPVPIGRKYCLNFAYSNDFEIDAKVLVSLFDPEKFMVKITPIHNNNACKSNGIQTIKGYSSYTPYKQIEENLKAVGFDVLVFIPSIDEEDGCITCGNAILGGSKIKQ